MVLDLHDRMKGKKLKAGLSMEEVTEFQNVLIGLAEHVETITVKTHNDQKTASEVRQADHEISAQIQLILVYLICGSYVYGRLPPRTYRPGVFQD